jgi:tRNA (cytidine/uridine-2'-O-)-methyltransferase
MAPPLHIVLYNPEIPQNTGNVGRLCAFTDARLHLIEPMGFSLEDRYLRRSGMDYWQHLDVRRHPSWQAFKEDAERPSRIWLFTTHAEQSYWDVRFSPGDALLFGNEGHGCPQSLHDELWDNRITLPRFCQSPLRSLNLATSVGIAAYEALRQIHRSPLSTQPSS